MALPAIIEGTWEEIARHARSFPVRQRFRLMPLPAENEDALAIMRQLAERNKARHVTDGTNTPRLIREARSGGAYGYDPGD